MGNTTAGSVNADFAIEVTTSVDSNVPSGERSLRQALELAYYVEAVQVFVQESVTSAIVLEQGSLLLDGQEVVLPAALQTLELQVQADSGPIVFGSRTVNPPILMAY